MKKITLKRKIVNKEVCVFFLLMCIVFVMYKSLYEFTVNRKLLNSEVSDNQDILYAFDDVYQVGNNIFIEGWATYLEEDITDVRIVFKATDNSQLFSKRAKLSSYKGNINNLDFENSELKKFKIKMADSKLKENVCYEMFINVAYGDTWYWPGERNATQKIATNKYLYDGKSYNFDPLNFYAPKVDDKYAKEAILNGELCVYDIEQGIWIYKYNNQLFSIVDYSLLGSYGDGAGIVTYFYPINTKNMDDGEAEYLAYYLKEEDYLNKEQKYFVYYGDITEGYDVAYIKTGVYFATFEKRGWKWRKFVPLRFWEK